MCFIFSEKNLLKETFEAAQWVFNRWIRKVKIQNCLRVSVSFAVVNELIIINYVIVMIESGDQIQ